MNKKNQGWLQEFLDNCQRQNKSPHTIKNYRSDLEKYLTWYEYQFRGPISQKNNDTIGQYKEFLLNGGEVNQRAHLFRRLFWFLKSERKKLVQKPLGNNSAKRHLSTLKNFYEFLKQNHEDHSNLFSINPVKEKIHSIKVKDIDIEHTPILPYDQWRTLIESTYRTRERVILQLLYWGGLRLSELSGLRYNDFQAIRKTITLRRKGGYRHELKIQNFDEIFKNIQFMEQSAQSEYIFVNKSNRAISTRSMYSLIKKLLLRSNCSTNIGPHSFRKACATNLYKRTKDLLFVRDYLNHSDAKVTQTYIDTNTLYLEHQVQ
ncbi:hypothetical protein BIY24_08010 [Halobacteriovorax marinus]|uniref:tyrosine-type recombinase/integrase n=1 Tax=Halobacteriovorax marinus TaxID=97084 RepID=UPI000BC2F983|nr:tyrosine-type recombinase/integrase [Halobacteriovorax marinus]ATH07894.1 hypothetical protein BIY24_08010 [Halobacteriovorax marinus]